jgi:hypothetical protein
MNIRWHRASPEDGEIDKLDATRVIAQDNRAHDFEAAIDRGRTCVRGKPRFDEWFQRLIMDLLRFEVANVALQQRNVPLDDVEAALTVRLFDIARGAIGESGARMRLARDVALDARHFRAESFLGLALY